MLLQWLLPLLIVLTGVSALLIARNYHVVQTEGLAMIIMVLTLAGWQVIVKLYYPMAGLELIGTLEIHDNELIINMEREPAKRVQLTPKDPAISIHYNGYEGEQIGRTTFNGYRNFITVGHTQTYRFWAFDFSVVAGLQVVLQRWYKQKIQVKEYCQDSRTFLLARSLSYEQIQAYKQEFGVSLYS